VREPRFELPNCGGSCHASDKATEVEELPLAKAVLLLVLTSVREPAWILPLIFVELVLQKWKREQRNFLQDFEQVTTDERIYFEVFQPFLILVLPRHTSSSGIFHHLR